MKSSKLILSSVLVSLVLAGCRTTLPQRTDTWFEIPPYESFRDAAYDTSALLALDATFGESENALKLQSKLEALGYRFVGPADRDNAVFKQPDYILMIPCLLYTADPYKDGAIYCGRCAVVVRKPIAEPNELVEPRTFVSFSRVVVSKAEMDRRNEYYRRNYQAIAAGTMKDQDDARERAFNQAIENMTLNPEFRKAIERKGIKQ